MEISYNWEITSLKTTNIADTSNIVVQTYWKKTGTDEHGNQGTFNGATPFPANNIENTNFIPFDQLTENDILTWVKSVVVGPYEEHVNDQIRKQIEVKKNLVVDSVLPWASNTTPIGE